jgi:hypothetical protein
VPSATASAPARLRAVRLFTGESGTNIEDADIPVNKGRLELVRPLVLVSGSNGSRSVTASATLDR